MSKATAQHQARRRKDVEKLYREGVGPSDIVETLADKHDNPSLSTIQSDITAIRAKWREQINELFGGEKEVAEWWIQLALADRRTAISQGNVALAYKIASDVAKLMGVDLRDLTVRFSVEDAKGFVQKVCAIVARHAPKDVAEKIADELDGLEND
jgi:hypothetical protein